MVWEAGPMRLALICSPGNPETDLGTTLLWRREVERHVATSVEQAVKLARSVRFDVVMVDSLLEGWLRLVQDLRAFPRYVSIAVVAHGDGAVEDQANQAGANAVFALPAGPEWDERLERLLNVPVRRQVRLPVDLEVDARRGTGVHQVLGTVLNISTAGMLVESEFDLRPNDVLDLRFRLPGFEDMVIGCGRVVRRAGPTAYGVEFYGLEGAGPDVVRRFVGSRAVPTSGPTLDN